MSIESLVAAARPCGGVFTRGDAARHGISACKLRTMQRRGEIRGVHPNTWQFAVAAWTPRTAIQAATKAAGGLAYASHSSAAYLLGLDASPRGRPELTLRGSVAPELDGVRVHRSRSLPDRDVTTAGGIPVTAGHRTVVDLAATLGESDRIDLVDRAICDRITSRPVLFEAAQRLRSGRRGAGTVVSVTAPGSDGVFWSALERMFGRKVRAGGLPLPAFNAPLRHKGRLFYIDALWSRQGLAVELRGLAFHSARADRLRDEERHNVLTQVGLRALVFGWRDIRDGFDDVAADLQEALLCGSETSRMR